MQKIRSSYKKAIFLISGTLFLVSCTSLDHEQIKDNSDNRKLLSSEIIKFRQTLEEDSGKDRAHLALGWSLLDRKDFTEAILSFNQALQTNPYNVNAYMGLGIAYENLENYHYAIDCYSEVVKNNPEWHFAYYQLGRLYKMTGNQAKALETLNLLVNQDKLLAEQLINFLYD